MPAKGVLSLAVAIVLCMLSVMGGLALLANPLPQRHLDSACRPLALPGDIRHDDGYRSRVQAREVSPTTGIGQKLSHRPRLRRLRRLWGRSL